jgi:crotonobetainyl-CoA:carnitine CoA-transferase CaiB-like acyl-CoA transferase
MLSPYRVLDLTDEKGFLAGKILADLGADVIKIEKPGGDASRNIGPFYHDTPDEEKSLYWFAYNANKRGITLDIETADGQEVFSRLVATTDFVIESFPPGFMGKLGLDYDSLSQLKRDIIMVSITPFGQTGPYSEYKASDIIGMASGGLMWLLGDPDRAPVRLGFPQAFLHAAAEAAAAALIALYHRGITGEGQYVDVAMQASLVAVTANAIPYWELNQVIMKRIGAYRAGLTAATRQRLLWPCKDGWVIFYILGGAFGAKSNRALTQWMDSEGMADDFIRNMDWEAFDMAAATQETQDLLETVTAKFFLNKTKQELYQAAIEKGLGLCPVSIPKDLIESPQLKARNFWVEVDHPELGTAITYPGAFAQASETPLTTRHRAPLIGEHNEEIYINELGLSRQQLVTLKQSGVI